MINLFQLDTTPEIIKANLPDDYPKFEIIGVIIGQLSSKLNDEFLDGKKKEVLSFIKERYENISQVKDNDIIKAYRQFYWKYCLLDPTKIRPAGEALLRRLLKNNSLPTIHPVVDAFNLISAKTGVPMCAYDLDELKLPLTFSLSTTNDVFLGIGMKQPKKLDEKLPIITDNNGQIVSIYPYRDADTTKLTKKTRNFIITADGVPGVQKSILKGALTEAIETIQSFCGGKIQGEILLKY